MVIGKVNYGKSDFLGSDSRNGAEYDYKQSVVMTRICEQFLGNAINFKHASQRLAINVEVNQ